jgi:hypothetical protein
MEKQQYLLFLRMGSMELIKWDGLEWNGESDDALKKKFFFLKK